MKINSKILLYLTLIAFTGCSKANDPSPFPPTPIAKDSLLGDWQKIDAGLNHMEDIIFLNPQKGYLCGPDGIYSSNDSGKSWNLTTATGAFYNLFFLNPQTGYVLGATEFAYTMDGGTTWIKKRIPIPNIPTTEHLRDLFFVSPSTGYLTARFGLYKTTDTGNTWQVNISLNSNGIFFLDSTTGWISSGGGIYQTRDAGRNWLKISTPVAYDDFTFNTLQFTDQSHAWITSFTFVNKTIDGGLTWTKTDFWPSEAYDIQFFDTRTGYLCTNDVVYKTLDGGTNWLPSCKIKNGKLVQAYFLDEHTGWACGLDGTLLRLKN